jgi:MFS-type transporter involved in bile tolerance (Atg22 family)
MTGGVEVLAGTTEDETAAASSASVTQGEPELAAVNIEQPLSSSTTSELPTPPRLPRWYPVRCNGQPVYHGNPEALGWVLDSVGHSAAVIGSGAFLGTALLRLAKAAAGCAVDPLPGTNIIPKCNNRIYGIRPSSLLTTYTIVVGVCSAVFLPLMGAMVDYTRHRRLIGRCLSVAFCIPLLAQVFLLSESTWLYVAALQVVVAFVGWAQTMVTYAYLPELTNSPKRLTQYTRSFTVISFTAMVLYLVVTVGIAKAGGFSGDTIATARLGTGISFLVSCVFLYLAWGHLMQRRPPARDLTEGQSLWTAGFIQVYRTIIHIYRHLPALKWFYLSISFIDAGVK